MFCYQCERAAKGTGCTTIETCEKTPEVSDLQDLLVYSLQGLSVVALEGRKAGVTDREVDEYTVDALFSKWPLPPRMQTSRLSWEPVHRELTMLFLCDDSCMEVRP